MPWKCTQQQLESFSPFYIRLHFIIFPFKRPYSYFSCWNGTSLELRLMRGDFSNVRDLIPFENQILLPSVSTLLSIIVVPVQYREYSDGLFTVLFISVFQWVVIKGNIKTQFCYKVWHYHNSAVNSIILPTTYQKQCVQAHEGQDLWLAVQPFSDKTQWWTHTERRMKISIETCGD